MIVSGGVNSWRGSKWVENDRNAALDADSRTYCAIVEVQRTGEKICLPSVIDEARKYEIAHCLVTVREPRSRRKRVGVKKASIRNPVNRGFLNSAIVDAGDIRNGPRANARR